MLVLLVSIGEEIACRVQLIALAAWAALLIRDRELLTIILSWDRLSPEAIEQVQRILETR